MKQLPLPVRVAAGLAVTAVDRARHLPEKLAELPVTVVSQALQLSMRLQQQMTEMAIKGDDALATLRPVEETPDWARFDEDEVGGSGESDASAARNGSLSRFDSVAADIDVELADAEDLGVADDRAENPAGDDGADPWAAEERALADPHADGEFDSAPPAALPTYPELSVPQLRARLRRLSEDALTELVEYERTHANRPEFVGMLTRRIATVREQR
ncbi:MAG TPA: lipid droplet-associated protein [Pseudonocardiaceae bacterium]|jgi:hypothetical protein|nr:lipid droplet-associated protein [Pseudonocardiaceae bacterium]